MKKLKLCLLLIPFISYSQEILPPEISLESGFYTEENMNVILTHEDPGLQILYTSDGSDPNIENLDGQNWNYKTHYPYLPGVPFGELLTTENRTYIYDSPLLIYDRTSDNSVLGTINTSILHNESYISGELYKCFVLRARAYNPNTEEYSVVVTRNYFITEEGANRYSIPVVALSLDADLLYSYEYGLNVPGIRFDDWRIDHPDQGFDGWANGNYLLSGSDTEREISFAYYEHGEELLNQNAGLRINGGYTRMFPNKSFRLYAKSDYGEKNFKHAFFEDYPYDKFKRLVLRNSGNDAVASFFRDSFIQRLSKNMHSAILESQPIVLFINGDYNGLRNIRERYDKKYFSMKYEVDEDEIDFLEYKVPEPEIKEGDTAFFHEMMNYFMHNSLESNSNFEQATHFIDQMNYADYYITYIYSANDDWLTNNVLLWRNRVEYDPSSPGEADGRLRWVLKDLDYGFYLEEREVSSYTYNTLLWATEIRDPDVDPYTGLNNQPTLIIRRLLENEEYKTYFINRFADILNTTYKEERVTGMIDEFGAIYEPEIGENSRRWNNFTAKPAAWEEDVIRMKDFGQNRPEHQRQHIVDKFELDGQFELTIDVSNSQHGFVHLNSIAITPETDGIGEDTYPWSGIYFKNVPVELTAIPAEGYQFVEWTGDVQGTDAQIILSSDENLSVTAVFEEKLGTSEFDQEDQWVLYPNPVSAELHIRPGEIFFGTPYIIYDTNGRVMDRGKYEESGINIQKLTPGVYFISLEKSDKKIKRKFIKAVN